MPQRARAKSLTIPPPVMGWNTKDPISQMDPLYAVELENYFPGDGVVAMRNGYRQHATGVGASTQVGTLAAFEYGTSALKLMAIANGDAWDVSSAGAAVDITGGAPTLSNRSATHQFRDRIFFKGLNVLNDVYYWTGGAAIAAPAFVGPGGDDKDLYAIGSYKNRLYFAQITVPSIWYGGVDQVTHGGSNLTEFSLIGVLKGPNAMIFFVGSIARAKQYSEEEIFVVITDNGEVLLYGGSYPGSADWGIVGRHQIPKPINDRAFFYAGSDLFVATQLGIVSIKKMMGGNYDDVWPLINTTIQDAFSDAFPGPLGYAGASAFGSAIAYPKGNYLLVNYEDPNSAGVFYQLVMNTSTGAWTKFSGQKATCWAVYNNELYFGGYDSNKVFKADNGYFDEDPASAGNPQNRTCVMRPAYNYFGDRQSNKQFTQANIILQESEGLNLTVDADVDYADTTPTSTVTDTTDTSYKRYNAKVGLKGIGKAASIRFEQAVTTKRRSIEAIEVFWNEGDIAL